VSAAFGANAKHIHGGEESLAPAAIPTSPSDTPMMTAFEHAALNQIALMTHAVMQACKAITDALNPELRPTSSFDPRQTTQPAGFTPAVSDQ
jgi:hypothetical protein